MNYILVSAEKKENIIHLICDKGTIVFPITYDDTIEEIVQDMKNEDLFITNIDFLKLVIKIFLKPNNRISKLS